MNNATESTLVEICDLDTMPSATLASNKFEYGVEESATAKDMLAIEPPTTYGCCSW